MRGTIRWRRRIFNPMQDRSQSHRFQRETRRVAGVGEGAGSSPDATGTKGVPNPPKFSSPNTKLSKNSSPHGETAKCFFASGEPAKSSLHRSSATERRKTRLLQLGRSGGMVTAHPPHHAVTGAGSLTGPVPYIKMHHIRAATIGLPIVVGSRLAREPSLIHHPRTGHGSRGDTARRVRDRECPPAPWSRQCCSARRRLRTGTRRLHPTPPLCASVGDATVASRLRAGTRRLRAPAKGQPRAEPRAARWSGSRLVGSGVSRAGVDECAG